MYKRQVYPSSKSCTPEQAEYIQRDLSRFEKALYSLDYDDPKLGYRAYIDVDSFVDYMVFNEFFQNYDDTRYSTYLSREVGGKLSIGPVWDFNNALDNYMEAVSYTHLSRHPACSSARRAGPHGPFPAGPSC